MPDKSYIGRQLAIWENGTLPEALRQDALYRAVSNSNLHGGEYPGPENVSPDRLQAYIDVCRAYVKGEIDLDLIQAQAEKLLVQNYQHLGDFGGE